MLASDRPKGKQIGRQVGRTLRDSSLDGAARQN